MGRIRPEVYTRVKSRCILFETTKERIFVFLLAEVQIYRFSKDWYFQSTIVYDVTIITMLERGKHVMSNY